MPKGVTYNQTQANQAEAITDALRDSGGIPVLSAANSAVILALQTAATGTNFTAFSSQACSLLDIQNLSGTDIEYRRGGAGNTFRIPNGTGRLIVGIANANEIGIRRVDQSNTQATVAAEAIS